MCACPSRLSCHSKNIVCVQKRMWGCDSSIGRFLGFAGRRIGLTFDILRSSFALEIRNSSLMMQISVQKKGLGTTYLIVSCSVLSLRTSSSNCLQCSCMAINSSLVKPGPFPPQKHVSRHWLICIYACFIHLLGYKDWELPFQWVGEIGSDSMNLAVSTLMNPLTIG